MKERKILPTTALFVSALLVALLLGEGAVRLFRPQFVTGGPDPIRNPFWRHDPFIGWAHTPGETGVFTRDEFSHLVIINQDGWRDIERVEGKPPGGFRVAVLGDSFTWGHGVGDDEIFTRLLEEDLGVEVLNFGLSASATDQQLLLLRQTVSRYAPDLLLVMVSRNDYDGNLNASAGSYPKPRFVMDEAGRLELTNVPVPEPSLLDRLHNRLRRRSGLLNLLESTLALDGRKRGQASSANPYALMEGILTLMRDEAASMGARLVVSFVPSTAHTYLDEPSSLEIRRVDRLSGICERLGTPFLDLVPVFRAEGRLSGGGRIYHHYIHDKHWNPLGHQLAARELARMLKEQGLVPVD